MVDKSAKAKRFFLKQDNIFAPRTTTKHVQFETQLQLKVQCTQGATSTISAFPKTIFSVVDHFT